jgi:putative Mg2+ transporter-C (MgtC) family protein
VPALASNPVLRLLAAVLAGALLGLPDWRKPGGLRTHVLVAVGAALFCVTGSRLVGGDKADLMRVLQGITSGVGFVGAATVLKQGNSVRGINVAASIWATAAVGCDVGLGDQAVALLLAGLVTVANWVFVLLERWLSATGRRLPATPREVRP